MVVFTLGPVFTNLNPGVTGGVCVGIDTVGAAFCLSLNCQ